MTLIFLSFNPSYAEDECTFFKNCSSGSSGSAAASRSHPSTSSSANFNPSTVSKIKGIGLETLYQPNNPLMFGLATGTGRVGAAVMPGNLENSFFGNRSVEIDQIYLQRRLEKKRYNSKKINLALGVGIIKNKNFSLDLGMSAKRNPALRKINPGFGFSSSLWIFNIGAYLYQDDVHLDLGSYINPRTLSAYSIEKQGSTYSERYLVQTYSFGLQLPFLTLDAGLIKTRYKFYPDNTIIQLYSSSLRLGRFILNYAHRIEESPNMREASQRLRLDRRKVDDYGGVQVFLNGHVAIGAAYNTFLLKEFSTTLTLFL